MSDWGTKVATLRKNKGWTQKDVAEKLYVSKSTVSKWENNLATPDIEMMKSIATLFQISVEELVIQEAEEDVREESVEITKEEGSEEKQVHKNRPIAIVCATLLVLFLVLGCIALYRYSIHFRPQIVDEFYEVDDTYGMAYNLVVVYQGKNSLEAMEKYGERIRDVYQEYLTPDCGIKITYWRKQPERDAVKKGKDWMFLFYYKDMEE